MADSTEIISKPTLDEVKQRLASQRQQLSDMHAPMARAATFLDRWVQKNFRGEGTNVGGWAPFAASTLERIQKYDPKRQPAKLLQNTGRLRISFAPFAHSDDAGIGSNLPYSKFHQEGTGNLPQRRMLPKKEEVADDVKRIFKDYTTQIATK